MYDGMCEKLEKAQDKKDKSRKSKNGICSYGLFDLRWDQLPQNVEGLNTKFS